MILLVSISAAVVTAQDEENDQPNLEIANEYIRIMINILEENMGRFSVGTTGGDPDRLGDEYQHLIYGGEEPWTSYTTVRIGNQNWVYGNSTLRRAGRDGLFGEMIQFPIIVDNSLVSAWQLGPIEVTQILSFARSSTTGLMDTAKIEYRVHNTDTVSHLVGLRLVLDTMLGHNDGAPFRLSDREILTDSVIYSDSMPDFWQAFDSLSDPQVMSQGTLQGDEVTAPDRVYFSNWGSIVDGLWNFDFQPGRDFTRAGEFELDSAIALYWDQEALRSNETRTYITYYGLGGVTIAPGDLSVGLTAPYQVIADRDERESFTIVAYIQNDGKGEARDITATLSLPEGLELIGGSTVQNLGDLDVGETLQTRWMVIPTGTITDTVSYELLVEAINSESNLVHREIKIVTPPYLEVDLIGPISFSVINERLSPLPMEVNAHIRNTGGATAYRVSANLSHPMLNLAKGDRATKYPKPIEPEEEIVLSWYLVPTGVSGPVYYSVDVNYGTASAPISGSSNDVFVPYIPPKVWFGEPQTTKEDNISIGDYFSISVWASNVVDFQSAKLDLSFDPDILEVVGRSLGITRGMLFVDDAQEPPQLFEWNTPTVDNTGGRITEIYGDRGQNDSLLRAFDTLITIHFRAKAAGEVQVNIDSIEIVDKEGFPVDVQIENKTIIIE